MRTLIKTNDAYKVFVNITDVDNLVHVSFETEFEHAKNPAGVQKKFEMFLDQEALGKLHEAFRFFSSKSLCHKVFKVDNNPGIDGE